MTAYSLIIPLWVRVDVLRLVLSALKVALLLPTIKSSTVERTAADPLY